MLLNIKVMGGASDQQQQIDVTVADENETIASVKRKIASQLKTALPAGQQRLMYKGKALGDSGCLKDYSINADVVKLHLFIKKAESSDIAAADKESNLTKELKKLGQTHNFKDPDQFAAVFNQELKKLANEMSLDDIEFHDECLSKKTEAAAAANN